MKTCFKCGAVKPMYEFYKHGQMADGHLGKCKDCTKKDSTKRRWANIDTVRAYDNRRSKEPHRVEVAIQYGTRYRKMFPDRRAAHSLLQSAVRSGRIQKPIVCEKCGSNKRLEAHHADYCKPLDVNWLCISCHRCLHRDSPIPF